MALRFDGKVAVVTGAGRGLGRAYALALADHGARVVVNDLGGSVAGAGGSSAAADSVVSEIKARGGDAIANHDSVEEGDRIIETAAKAFGRVDILINNAGIIRDVPFATMTDEDWDVIAAVHLRGAFKCTKAAWPHMLKNSFGRVLNIGSAAGIYGSSERVNYSTAKSGILGFTKSCALAGAERNIFSNCICPLAASRMTEPLISAGALKGMSPDVVVPLALWLCHEGSGANAEVIEAGGGWFAKIRVERARGAYLKGTIQLEDVQNVWDKVRDFENADHPTTIQESFAAVAKASRPPKPEPKL